MEVIEAYHPFLPGIREDPYPIYRQLREHQPVHRSSMLGAWVLTRHADIVAVLGDRRFSADRRAARGFWKELDDDRPISILGLDPPDHTRLRTLVSRAFTPRTVELLRPRVEALVSDLLDHFEAAGGGDWIHQFAYPLPVTVIAEMLGVPSEDRERFQSWSAELAASLDPIISPERTKAAGRARAALGDYLLGIVEQRRRSPREDLISAMVATQAEGEQMTQTELLTMCVLLLIAGHETTVNLLGNGLLALLRNPVEMERLRSDPALAAGAIEELLRFDSPVQLTSRISLEAAHIGGVAIGGLEPVILLLGAGNRDPDAFAEPDQLKLDRTQVSHLSFSRGIHFCLGAPLARLEAQVALSETIRRFPGLRLAGEPVWREQVVLRGMERLPVATG